MASLTAGSPADVMVVDDTPANLALLTQMLRERGHRVHPVPSGRMALEVARRSPPDLVLLDINMPEMNGFDCCAAMKSDARLAGIPVIFISANHEVMDKVRAFAVGGVDYVTKPFQFEEVEARVEAHLEIRRLRTELENWNRSLQEKVRAQVHAISEAQIATILALAKLSEYRDEDTGNHILRVQHYSRALARRMAEDGAWGGVVDGDFIETIHHASALHDVGKVGISDAILLKPGKLTPEEVTVMKTHSELGARALDAVLRQYPGNAMIRMGRDIAMAHHERWDGTGYPLGISGTDIPLAARIVVIADQYDALRSKRPYKPPFDAAKTFTILTEGDGRSEPRHLDPAALAAFASIAKEFGEIHDGLRD